MTKTEAKEIAKDVLMEAIAEAYYKLDSTNNVNSEEDFFMVNSYLEKYGIAMGKRIGKEYYTL